MTKKLIGMILSLVTIFAVTLPALAAERGSVSIENPIEGKQYTIYRIFDLETYNAEENAYSYKINSVWGEWTRKQTQYLSVDELGYVHWKEDADPAAFAKEALSFAKSNNISNQGTQKAGSSTLSFPNLELGYYLIDSSVGALCSLDTTNPNAEMREKNIEPTVKKEVEEDSTGEYGETNDADIKQQINFRTIITVQAGAENYVLHDKMSVGLTFGDVTSVVVDNREVAPANYTMSEETSDSCTFEIRLEDAYVQSLTPGKEIVVNYTGYLNENAVVGGNGNLNETWLTYGDDNTSAHDYTRTFTWEVPFFKFAEDAEEKKGLEDARFILSKMEDGSYPICLRKVENEMTYVVDTSVDTTEIVTDPTGEFVIRGLDEGIYYLHETKAPTGYNKLFAPVVITITSNETGEDNSKIRIFEFKVKNEKGEDVPVSIVEVENKTDVELPRTGDIGTTWFYVLGGLLFISAATILIIRKRMYEES